jgi:hypothetical protein
MTQAQLAMGKAAHPSPASIDSQSIKASETGSQHCYEAETERSCVWFENLERGVVRFTS